MSETIVSEYTKRLERDTFFGSILHLSDTMLGWEGSHFSFWRRGSGTGSRQFVDIVNIAAHFFAVDRTSIFGVWA